MRNFVVLAFLAIAAIALVAGCTTTLTFDLKVDRPLALTIDGERAPS